MTSPSDTTPLVTHKVAQPYSPPEVTDYGSLVDVTAAHVNGSITDVTKGSPGPAVFS